MEILLLVPMRIVILLFVTLWKQAIAQCSEAHVVACSQAIVKIEKYRSEFSPIGGLLPDYNRTTLRTVCSLFQDLQNCTQPYLRNCHDQTIKEFQMLHSAFSPICGKLMDEYLQHRSCFRGLQSSYELCQNRRQSELNVPKENKIQYDISVCQATNQYVKCIYLATALRCSINAANVYFQIVSKSIALLLMNSKFVCDIMHPSDVISILTTTRPTSIDTSLLHITSTSLPEDTSGKSRSTSYGIRSLPALTTFYLCLCFYFSTSFNKIYDAIIS